MDIQNFKYLPIRHRHGFDPEDSHTLPHLTQPNLVTPLEKIVRAQAQGLPVPFNAGEYLEADFSIIDGLDAFELFEFRQNLQTEIEERKAEFHAATKKLSEIDSKRSTSDDLPDSDPNPSPPKKVAKNVSKDENGENAEKP